MPSPEKRPLIDEVLNPVRNRSVRQLPVLMSRSLGLVWAAAPRELLWATGSQLIGSGLLFAQLLLARHLLGGLLTATSSHEFQHEIPTILLLAGCLAISGLANVTRTTMLQLLSELLARHSFGRVLAVTSRASLLDYETPVFHDRLQRALLNTVSRPLQMVTGVVAVASSSVGVFAVGLALATISPVLLGLAVVGALPLWWVTTGTSRAQYRFGYHQTGPDRRRSYLQLLLTNKDMAKEIRAYSLQQPLRDSYRQLADERVTEMRSLVRQRLLRGIAGSVLASAVTAGALVTLLELVARHDIGLASAGAATAALLLLAGQLQGLVAGVASLYESALFVKDLHDFIDLEALFTAPVEGAAPAPHFSELEATDVCFTYPSGRGQTLRGVSITLKQGETIALVGENGSGKTTLAKVLAGLLPPTEGTVTWNGQDYASIEPESMRAQVAVLFQDFVRYRFTLRENVALGRPGRSDEESAVMAAVTSAGAAAITASLPRGLATQLGPEFLGGTDLSGGQWQRVALARAFYRDAPVVILDEPTAALDPHAEAALFETARALFTDRSVILISHRLAGVRHVDRIYVLDEGRVVEAGSHDELMTAGGVYKAMYEVQADAFTSRATDAL